LEVAFLDRQRPGDEFAHILVARRLVHGLQHGPMADAFATSRRLGSLFGHFVQSRDEARVLLLRESRDLPTRGLGRQRKACDLGQLIFEMRNRRGARSPAWLLSGPPYRLRMPRLPPEPTLPKPRESRAVRSNAAVWRCRP
jgi:hypothetical protein